MRIGEMAAEAGVNVQTIRFYEREGLLRKPARTRSGYRAYERHDLDRVQFIRACQGLGFTLREVRELIRLHRLPVPPERGPAMSAQTVREIVEMAEERIRSIEEKMAALAKMRDEMQSVVRALSWLAIC